MAGGKRSRIVELQDLHQSDSGWAALSRRNVSGHSDHIQKCEYVLDALMSRSHRKSEGMAIPSMNI